MFIFFPGDYNIKQQGQLPHLRWLWVVRQSPHRSITLCCYLQL